MEYLIKYMDEYTWKDTDKHINGFNTNYLSSKYICSYFKNTGRIHFVNLKTNKTIVIGDLVYNRIIGMHNYNCLFIQYEAYSCTIIELNIYTQAVITEIKIESKSVNFNHVVNTKKYIYNLNDYIYDKEKRKIYKIRNAKQFVTLTPYFKETNTTYIGIYKEYGENKSIIIDFTNLKFYKNNECEFILQHAPYVSYPDFINEKFIVKTVYDKYIVVYDKKTNKCLTFIDYKLRDPYTNKLIHITSDLVKNVCVNKKIMRIECESFICQIDLRKCNLYLDAIRSSELSNMIKNELESLWYREIY